MMLGSYELGREIGSGAMGAVHYAVDRDTGQSVAIKRIHLKYMGQTLALRRFDIEVQTAARLRHPNIVSVIASGMEPRGTPYCVMEWIDGQPLSAWSRTFLPWTVIRWIARDLLDALAYAHARGVVHRDLKPANLLIEHPHGDAPRIRLADFGIARVLEQDNDPDATQLTMADRVIGTPAYLSPEQAQGFGHLIGPHTDLYALGVMFHELIAGRLPFHGLRIMNLLMAHVATPAPPLNLARRPEVPHGVIDTVAWLLRKSPDHRPDSAASVRDALELNVELPRIPLPPPPGTTDVSVPNTLISRPSAKPIVDLSVIGGGPLEALDMFGRDREFASLVDYAEGARTAAQARLVWVSGEAGVGKTRLVHEVRYDLEERDLFRGLRLAARARVAPDEPMRVAIARLLYAERLEGPDLRLRLNEVSQRYKMLPVLIHGLANWMLSESGDVAEHVDTAVQALRVISQQKPLAIFVDGADAETSFALDVLSRLLLEDTAGQSLVVYATSRAAPDGLDTPFTETFRQLAQKQRAKAVALGPLAESEVAALVRPFVGAAAHEIAVRARGNPLFAMELARFRGPELEHPSQTLPGSIADIWRRRIDEAIAATDHPELCRVMLEATALVGPTVQRRFLLRLVVRATQRKRRDVVAVLDHWVTTGVLSDDAARDRTIGFVHNLGYEYVADNVDPTRPLTHQLVVHIADWVVEKRRSADPDILIRMGDALADSGEGLRAARVHLLAGELLVGRLEYERAEQVLKSAQDAATSRRDAPLRARALAELVNLFTLKRDLEGARNALNTASDFETDPDLDIEARVGLMQARGTLLVAKGDLDGAISELKAAVRSARSDGEDPNIALLRANVRTQLAGVLEQFGELADAERQSRFAIKALAKADAPDRLRAKAHISLARLCAIQGRTAEAEEAATTALPLAETAGDRRQIDEARRVLGHLASSRGDLDQAVQLAERILDHQNTFGDRNAAAATYCWLGTLERERANFEVALTHHQSSHDLAESNGHQDIVTENLLGRIQLYWETGQARKAEPLLEALLERVRDASDTTQHAGHRIDGLHLLAKLAWASGDLGLAERSVADALLASSDPVHFVRKAHCRLVAGVVATERRNFAGAKEHFAEARATFADMNMYAASSVTQAWLALADANFGGYPQAEMTAVRLEEALTQRPVIQRLMAEGLERLGDVIGARRQDLAWRLEDAARRVRSRLRWRSG